MLTKTQRNQIFAAIQDAGLDPASFQVDPMPEVEMRVEHPATRAYCSVDFGEGMSGTYWSLGLWPMVNERPLLLVGAWQEAVNLIRKWAFLVRQEADSPDLWETVQAERGWVLSTEAELGSNQPFRQAEREQLHVHLDSVRAYLAEHHRSSSAALQAVNEKLDYLSDSVERLGRVDWKNVALAVIINIVTTLALDRASAQAFVSFVGNLLGPLVAGAHRAIP